MSFITRLVTIHGFYLFDRLYKMVKTQVMDQLDLLQINYYVPEVGMDKNSMICPICLSQIEYGVTGQPCKHQFCGQCILNYWKSKYKCKLRCPFCRNYEIRIQSSQFIREISKQLLSYNQRYGNRGVELVIRIFALPTHIRSLYNLSSQIYDFFKFLKNLFLVVWLSILIIYIISPIDLLPELYLGLVGLIDDFIACILVMGIVTRSSLFH